MITVRVGLMAVLAALALCNGWSSYSRLVKRLLCSSSLKVIQTRKSPKFAGRPKNHGRIGWKRTKSSSLNRLPRLRATQSETTSCRLDQPVHAYGSTHFIAAKVSRKLRLLTRIIPMPG